jgi:hypothetical protein
MRFPILPAFIFIFIILFLKSPAQGVVYEGPDDGAGDPAALREGCMNGNRVVLQFQNTTELGMHPATPNYSSWWPRGDQGQEMHWGVAMLFTTRVYINKQNQQPVDQPAEIARLGGQGLLDTLYFCQTHFRIGMDQDPEGQVRWGFYPVWGYFNPNHDSPAMSNNPNSWPPEGWPQNNPHRWPGDPPQGEWYGRSGRRMQFADLEALLVANDAQDQEYVREETPVKYFPRGDRKIGHDIAVNAGRPWGGLGLRVFMRLYQWDYPEVRDVIFFEYDIANLADYDYPEMGFGYLITHAIADGAEGSDDAGSYNTELDMIYNWYTYYPRMYTPATTGFAFLETPGISNDHIDNDQDGLTDETRDNQPGRLLAPEEDITNLEWFLAYYGKKQQDLREHWDADEDQDWDDGYDADRNGDYLGQDEYPGDDVGLDGIGPGELAYTGPDEGECDHKPSYRAGIGCEPDFNIADVSESDMVGLTSFQVFNHPPTPYEQAPLFFNDDRGVFAMVSSGSYDPPFIEPADLLFLAGSYSFPLLKSHQQHLAAAELHSYENLNLISAPDYPVPNLFQLKRMAQIVYDWDFRFVRAPLRPTLTATPGDSYVLLTWDDRADKLTREPLLNNINDFEGYKIYRSSNIDFSDTVTEGIIDGYPIGRKPIFRCDRKDGITGFAEWAIHDGLVFYLGDDSGITHTFRDNNVQNGCTYYYAVVAYDYGIPPEKMNAVTGTVFEDKDQGIAPAENNTNILYNASGDITFLPGNCAVVVPGPKAAGTTVEDTDIDIVFNTEKASQCGNMEVEVAESGLLKTGSEYFVTFKTLELADYRFYDLGYEYICTGIQIHRKDGMDEDVLVYEDIVKTIGEYDEKLVPAHYNSMLVLNDEEDEPYYHLPSETMGTTDIFEGLRLSVRCTERTALDPLNSGWLNSKNYPINLRYSKDIVGYSFDYRIVFTYEANLFTKLPAVSTIRDSQGDRITEEQLLQIPTNFYVELPGIADPDNPGSILKMELLIHDLNGSGRFEPFEDRVLVGTLNTVTWRWNNTVFDFDFVGLSEYPHAGDVYIISVQRPFSKTDTARFTVNAHEVTDSKLIASSMDNIRVVPNPYVLWNTMEPSPFSERRLMFTHLPEKCTIKIFTVSGILVRTLNVPEDGLVSYNGVASTSDGIVHWDLRNRAGRDIAAGLYLYHVKDLLTGKEKLGKFAVIK